MADLNKVMLIGRLTRDPQLKTIPSSQTSICEFGFAVGRKYKTASGEQREETAFVDCTIFGRAGEVFHQYMAKGRQVYIEGRLKFDSWEDKQGGGKRSKLSLVVEEFQFLGNAGENARGGGGGGGDEDAPPRTAARGPAKPAPAAQQPDAPEAPYGDEPQFTDDDIPF